jgi:hypothetical protein
MRIFGGRDYYDGAGMGTDETVTFVRTPRMFTDIPIRMKEDSYRSSFSSGYEFFHIILAGELFPGMIEIYRGRDPLSINWSYRKALHYDVAEAQAAAIRRRDDGCFSTYHYARTLKDAIDQHFAQKTSDTEKRWLAANGIVTGRMYYDHQTYHAPLVLEANAPNLADHEVYKVIDPATAHMRIAGYISGVIGTSPDIVQIDDAHRKRKAGFDEQSFRMRKGTKKPRRKHG